MNRKQRRAAASQGGSAAGPPGSVVDQQLALALQSLRAGRADLAEAPLRAVLEAAPNHPDGHFLMASVHQAAGRNDAAIASYRRTLALQPRFGAALCNLGNVLQSTGRADEAVECYRRALALAPDDALVHSNLGSALKELGRLDEAAASFERALALRPDQPEARLNLANLWMLRGELERAEPVYREIARQRPDLPGALSNLGMILRTQGRMAEALEVYHRSLALNPADAAAHANLGNVLLDLGRFAEARASYERAVALRPDYPEVRSNILMLLNYDPSLDEAALLDAHRAFDRQIAPPPERIVRRHANARDPERMLRVGYVSSDFYVHPVGFFLLPVLAAHDATLIESHCYSGRRAEDPMTATLRARAAHWHSIVGMDDETLAARIVADGIDILVDLSGHTAGGRLPVFARKPAPVQASWLGYFNTTGVSAIDYVLMDEATVPEGAERWFTETVVRLPEGRFCYAPPDYAPAVAPLPARARGFVTFGSFNNMSKVTPAVIELWAAVLRAVPDARLMLKWQNLADEAERGRLHRAFGAHGIAPERLELRGRTPHAEMLAEYGAVDIGIDPFPFCGGLTSCEALWMGVPIVTLPGVRPVSRQTLGFLTQLGLRELAASSPERYVALAAELAGDLDRLADLRATLRSRMTASPLCDGARFTRGLEAAYRAMWRTWCAHGV
ncbi:MAG TPA: tetratricopeptide repeat protein [Candidatus Sulfotelmatobacter sp.]|nr:tetratricopeptide repeat protein [Candidatus Sulfotelmatobacter sp.]